MVMDNKFEQVVLEGTIKPCKNASDREIIVANWKFLFWNLVLIVNVPTDGEDKVKIYIKPATPFVHRGTTDRSNADTRVADKRDARNDDEYEYSDTGAETAAQ